MWARPGIGHSLVAVRTVVPGMPLRDSSLKTAAALTVCAAGLLVAGCGGGGESGAKSLGGSNNTSVCAYTKHFGNGRVYAEISVSPASLEPTACDGSTPASGAGASADVRQSCRGEPAPRTAITTRSGRRTGSNSACSHPPTREPDARSAAGSTPATASDACVSGGKTTGAPGLLQADHHGVGPHEVLGARAAESCVSHPSHAVGGGVVEAMLGLDEHVQAHQQSERVLGSIVVDNGLVDDQRAPLGQPVVCLPDQQPLLVQSPVVEDVSHQDNISFGELVCEEVTADKSESVADAMLVDEVLEHRSHFRKVEADAPQVIVRQDDLYREVALRCSEVDEGLVLLPWELAGDRKVCAMTQPGHRSEELLQASGIGVESLEERHLARLRFVLELARPQSLGEVAPEGVQAMVGHLQNTSDVGGLLPVQEQVRARRVAVHPVLALEEPQRYE